MATKRRPEDTSFSSEGEEGEDKEDSVEESEIEDSLDIDVEDDSSSGSSSEGSDAESDTQQEDLESLLTSGTSEEEDDKEEEEEIYDGESKRAEYFIPGADGRPRLIKPEIDPVYDSDDSDLQEDNTIGNIPLSAYDSYPHIGYDINGKRILRPATGSALDQLLDSIEIPEGWTGLLDKNTGESLKLTSEELDLIRKVDQGKLGDSDYNPYEDAVDWFTQDVSVTPLSAAPEPKRRFIPSKNESKRVMKIVRAIREGRIVPNKEKKPSDEEEEEGRLENLVDIWADNAADKPDHVMHIPAPKLPPPSHDESYNPPEEYLLTEQEKKQWQELDPSDREKNFIPQKFSSLRNVPGYSESVRERFERSLDLYLAPRVRKNKLNIDPESLVPKLPSPKDLRPFPTKCSIIYSGHQGRVRSTCVDPSGVWLASGGDDHHIRIWEVSTGRQVWSLDISKTTDNEPIDSVEWNPVKGNLLLAVASGRYILLLVPPIGDTVLEEAAHELISAGWSLTDKKDEGAKSAAEWRQHSSSKKEHIDAIISVAKRVKQISWHRRGDYFLSTSPEGASSAIVIHQLSKHKSQAPFRKSKGIVQAARFHPFRSIIFVATQRYIRIYDLSSQTMVKKLLPGVRWLSNFDVHPRGDQVVASSYDRKVVWIDMELSNNPYKTLRYHDKAVRDVAIHKGNLPLFCSASDDGNINVFHVTVYDDLMMNPLLVPLKILKGHKITSNLGVLSVMWHPSQPWLFSAGADGSVRLWTN